MKNIRRIEMNSLPPKIQKLGDNSYYYNYDIQSKEVVVTNLDEEEYTETRWDYIQVHLFGRPNYIDCINAVIREFISQEEELALINKYNGYQEGTNQNSSSYNEYIEYINLVSDIKLKVKKDFNVTSEIEPQGELIPIQKDIVNLLKIMIKSVELSDEESLQVKSLYPLWTDYIGNSLNTGDKITYLGKLYKVKQNINTVLENQPPSIETAALYEEINEKHAGTKEDPIPFNNNMELELGKYYSQNGVTYMCFRDSQQPVYQNLADLVGIYVQIAE